MNEVLPQHGVILGPDDFTLVTTQDVEPILDHNKAEQNDGQNGWSKSRVFRKVAEIPDVVALIWLNKYGVNVLDKNHAPAVARLLNDPDWRYLRTAGGRLKTHGA